MYLSNMSFPAVAALDRDATLVVCAVGALEQHSHHMPLGTDHMLGDAVVSRMEARRPDRLLCLPTIWSGCSSHHLGYAGTISVSVETLSRLLADVVASVERSGFRRLLIVNSHGGNRAAVAATIQEMGTRHPDVLAAGVSYWDAAREGLVAERETDFGGMGHACELETSLMLVDRPEIVDMTRAAPDGLLPPSRFSRGEMLSPAMVSLYRPVQVTSRHGGFGDPTTASAQKGERFFGAITAAMIDLCDDILEGRI